MRKYDDYADNMSYDDFGYDLNVNLFCKFG